LSRRRARIAQRPGGVPAFPEPGTDEPGAVTLWAAENYPQLKSDANFRDLQAQLEARRTASVARNRYIKSVQEYNVLIRQFRST
jgi:hypothetical protein